MQTIKFHRYWLVILFSIALWNLTAQSCSLSFEGEETQCYGEMVTYIGEFPAGVTDAEWTIDGTSKGRGSEILIDWEQEGAGAFELCLSTDDSCNGAIPDPFCRTITVLPKNEVDSVAIFCTGHFIEVINQETGRRDTAFSETKTHTWTYRSVAGCDSIVRYNLTILPTETNSIADTSICQGDYIYLGIDSFNVDGRHCGRVLDEEGCITFLCRRLTVRDSIKTMVDTTICYEAIPFAIEDTLITTDSRFLRVYPAADGCDSTVFVSVTVREEIRSTRKDTLCAEEVLVIGNTTFNTSGTHEYIYESVFGCDSTVTINLLMRGENETDVPIEICQEDPLPIDRDIVTLAEEPDTDMPGTIMFQGVAIDQFGCDSTITYTLEIKPKSFLRVDTTLCYGSSINIGGNIIRSASTATVVLKNQYDCDSVITYAVRITPEQPMHEYRQVICPNEEHYIGDSLITETGFYQIIIPTDKECDSLVIADLTVKTEEDVTKVIDGILCAGDTYREITDTIIRSGGTHVLTHLKTTTDCDSIIILNLQVLSGEESETVSESICAGDYFVHPDFPLDTLRTQSTFFLAKRNPETCIDFDLAITINFMDSVHVAINELLCEGDSIGIGNKFYKEEGVFIDTLQRTGELGCDSIITLTIELRDCNIEIEEMIDTAACSGTATGSIDFFVTLGKPPFIYELNSPLLDSTYTDSISALEETISFDSLAAGTYVLTIQDTVNGYKEFDLIVPQPEVMSHEWEVDDQNGFQLACNGDRNGFLEIIIAGGTMPYTYLWNTGETAAGMTDLGAETYSITVTDANGCELVESFSLEQPMPLLTELDIVKPNCEDLAAGNIEVSSIDGGVSPYQYKLNEEDDFAAKNRFRQLIAGEYHLMIQDANGCVDTSFINLPVPQIPELNFEKDIYIELGDMVEVDLEPTVALSMVTWEGPDGLSCYDCPDPIAQPLETQTFTVTGMSVDSCLVTNQLTIFVDKKRDVFIPNIFSPNGDGINDRLIIHGGPEVDKILSFRVYARWGGLVFDGDNLSPNDEMGAWDGTFAGKRLRPGAFVWKATISFIDGVEKEYFGDVLIK